MLNNNIANPEGQDLHIHTDKLMHFKDYSGNMHPHPFEKSYSNTNAELFLFASKHCTDPSDPMFGDIDDRLVNFIKDKDPKNIVVLVEGGVGEDSVDRNAAMQSGEMAFTRFTAEQLGIDQIESPEPTEKQMFTELETHGFTLDEYIFRQFLNIIYYKVNTKKEDVTIADLMNYYKYMYHEFEYDWIGLSSLFDGEGLNKQELDTQVKNKQAELGDDFPAWLEKNFIERLMGTFTQLADKFEVTVSIPTTTTPKEVISFNKDQLEKLVSPQDPDSKTTSKLPRMSGLMSKFRDQLILQRLFELLEQGKDVFVTFGASHVYMWQPALDSYFGE